MKAERFYARVFFILAAAALFLSPKNTHAQPNITIYNPADESFYASSAIITLDAYAEDFVANITTVSFYTNNVLLTTLTNVSGGGTFEAIYQWTNATTGFYNITARASNDVAQTSLSDPNFVIVYTNTGALTLSITGAPSTVNLTTNGTADWAQWGLYSPTTFIHKAGVVSQITNYTLVYDAFNYAYQATSATISNTWTDGTPVRTVTNSPTGVFTYDNGFNFTIAAATNDTLRTLQLYLGAYQTQAKLLIYLSDCSAQPISDLSLQNYGGITNAICTLKFKAGKANQFLNIRYTLPYPDYSGYIHIQAATLATSNLPPQTAITNPAIHSVYQYPTNLAIDATASDADGTVAKVEFFDNSTKIGELTSSPYHFIWTNAPAGLHNLTSRATDNTGTTFTSIPVDTFITTGGGMLSGALSNLPTSVDLGAEGRTDWAHWGLVNFNSFNHRSSVSQRISDVTKVGGGSFTRLTDSPCTFSWTNGTPTASASSTTGIFIYGANNGFQLTAPADTLKRRLKIYLSAFAASAKLEASLSDASAVSFVDYSISNAVNNARGVYTLDYAAASSNKTLTVKFTSSAVYDLDYGNVTIEAASLSMLDTNLRNPQKTNGTFRCAFPSDDSQPYVFEYANVFPAASWTTVNSFSGNGGLTNLVDSSATTTQRFYRVRFQ